MNDRTIRAFNTFFILAVFSLFAICSLLVVLFGANVYHGLVSDLDANNEVRTSLSYVSNKVRAADSRDISVRTDAGQQVLVITRQYSGEKYDTYIYHYQGSLYELFTKAQNQFVPGNGDKITPLSGFSVKKDGDRLTLTATGKDRRTATIGLQLT